MKEFFKFNKEDINKKHIITRLDLRREYFKLLKENKQLKAEIDTLCLHCGGSKPHYCEACYQVLLAKNLQLQVENKDLKEALNLVR